MKVTFLLFCLLYTAMTQALVLPETASGNIKRIELFQSAFVPARNIDIWLPDNYSSLTKYDVLYMHDGQMLFDANTTWNNQEWQVDEIAGKLMAEGKVRPFIVVGIWNAESKRYPEYFPEKVYRGLPTSERLLIKAKLIMQSLSLAPVGDFYYGDQYVKFLTDELIPYIENNFSVNKGPQHRFLAGSSMGGLMSWYALFERPDIFGGAACLSTHWPGMFDINNPFPKAFEQYITNNINRLSNHKVYFDIGDQTLDAQYPPLQKQIDAIFKTSYASENWRSELFPGHQHDESSWASRFHLPLLFLFGNKENQ